jgi:leucine dehydrogenase
MWSYDDSRAALADALRLSRAMTYKAAVADLAQGGGKGVIMLRPETQVTPRLRRAALLDFGDTVAAVDGRYITAEDVGTSSRDMTVIAQRTQHVAGLARSRGGGGDPSPLTALGVLHAIRACLEWTLSSPRLTGRRVCVIGLGHVGSRVARLCARAGARLVASDVDTSRRQLARELGAGWISPDRAIEAEVDVLVPCALGGILNEDTAPLLRTPIIAGAANNQLADDGIADLLAARGVLWAPDFVVNAGGLINIAVELAGYDPAQAKRRVRAIGDTLRHIFEDARSASITPLAAATHLARERLGVARSAPPA